MYIWHVLCLYVGYAISILTDPTNDAATILLTLDDAMKMMAARSGDERDNVGVESVAGVCPCTD